jgi:hypothetical protein
MTSQMSHTQPFSPRPPPARSEWASRIPGLSYVPGFRTSVAAAHAWTMRRRFVSLVAMIGLSIASMGGCATAATASAPRAPTGVSVLVSTDGPWTASMAGLDPDSVTSVTYWIRDARQHWRSTAEIVAPPFEAPIDWWDGDNSGSEVVTAHVTLRSGKVVKDPGGWHWIRGPHTNPAGTAELQLNVGGSASASYTPAAHLSVIRQVDFWLRNGNDHWAMAGTASSANDGTYSIGSLLDTDRDGWNGTDAALSIHVVWPNGAQYVDPAPWIWSDHFLPASPTPAPPTSAPLPTSAPPTSAPAPAPVAPPPPAAAPTPAPAAPPSCYPLSNSGTCYRAGEFCRNSDHGATGRTAGGEAIVCRNNNGWRWEPA